MIAVLDRDAYHTNVLIPSKRTDAEGVSFDISAGANVAGVGK